MINNRQSGRRRGRGGVRQPGGPGPRGEPGNRVEVRQRGNAQQLHEKYKNLARDAAMQGDRVTAEYYLQFADHYFRVLNESRSRQEESRPRSREQGGRQDYDEDRGEDRGEEQERDDDREDATAPISIAGLPPAIGGGEVSRVRDEESLEGGESETARRDRPRRTEGAEVVTEDEKPKRRTRRPRRAEAEDESRPETLDA